MRKAKLLSVFICVLLSLLGSGNNWVMAQGTPPIVGEKSTPIYRNDVLGVSLRALPSGTRVVEDQYLADDFGFTLVDSDGRMVLRVAWYHRDTQDEVTQQKMEQRAQQLVESFPGLNLDLQPIFVGGYKGVMVEDAPGIDPSTYVYVTAYGRLYEIVCPQQENNRWGCESLLSLLSFEESTRSLADLQLTLAEDALHDRPPILESPQPKGLNDVEIFSYFGKNKTVGSLAAQGCTNWPVWKFLQTPWASTANGPGTILPQGWSQAGPSFYGEGLHKYCNRVNGLNDYHALDFPLKEWDIVYPPASGQVLYAGWAKGGWASLGRVVIVDLGNGYWSMAAHLRQVNVFAGQNVQINTVIGYAGRSGNYQDTYWSSVHLHQGLYLNAQLYQPYGGIYGGQSVEPRHMRFFGNGGGFYDIIGNQQRMSW